MVILFRQNEMVHSIPAGMKWSGSLASEEGTALTVKRKAGIFLDKVSAVDLRKNQLEEALDKLIKHTYELNDTDFDPLTG